MATSPGITYRPFTPGDAPAAFAVFRRALFDYLFRIGQADATTAADPPIEEAWGRQRVWVEHLVATAAENWVAEDGDGRVVGWAMSVERDGVFELTHFFVEPGIQGHGIGRALMQRAFPIGRGQHRIIMATQDARALKLYLEFGVRFAAVSADLLRAPEAAEPRTDLSIERLDPGDPAAGEIVGSMEVAILGHRRAADLDFLLGLRPAWVARRDGAVAGIAFGADGYATGPIAALNPTDMPALLDVVENQAHTDGIAEIGFCVPLVNRYAVDHLLARRFRIDPFYIMVLADDLSMQMDRWVHTAPEFII
jgi:GNAT superfamily N-acetyltransferase